MKTLLIAISVVLIVFPVSCDLRSGTAKGEMDKFSGTPTPTITPPPTPTPVDAADIVQVDTTLEGDTLTVNGHNQNKTITCSKFDRVMINGSSNIVAVSGVCRQIMTNGDGNQITADAAAEFTFNGTANSLKYARFANGKQPLVVENQAGNVVEKIAFEPAKNGRPQGKDRK
jgi:hypothetical protein